MIGNDDLCKGAEDVKAIYKLWDIVQNTGNGNELYYAGKPVACYYTQHPVQQCSGPRDKRECNEAMSYHNV
jgi:hypothetical protein